MDMEIHCAYKSEIGITTLQICEGLKEIELIDLY